MTELENDGRTQGDPPEESSSAGAGAGAGVAVALSALTLAGCGGGGGSSAPPPTQNPPPPPPVPPPVTITDAEASRFLLQAQFAVTDSDLAAVKANGYSAWLASSYNQPLGQTGVAWLDSRGHNSITSEQRYFWPQFGDFMIWNQLLAGPDQMRKRLALALSEFFVVSLSPIDGFYPPYVIGAYWDVLTANVHGNFRTLLERITLNAGMGFFLNTKGNLKEDASGRQPDENYAREVMQLFTIGLLELNQDGTPRLDANNQPIETYGQSDITNLARVFTGYDWDYLSNGGTFTDVAWHDYDVPNTRFATNPMLFRANNHSNLAVTFLGTTIPAIRKLRHGKTFGLVLGDIAGGAQSFAEINVGKVCAEAGLTPPDRQVVRLDKEGRRRYLDCVWVLPDGRVIVLEVDGSFHAEVRAWWKDMKRERAVVVQGDTVLRCSSMELRLEPNDVIADLRAIGVPSRDRFVHAS